MLDNSRAQKVARGDGDEDVRIWRGQRRARQAGTTQAGRSIGQMTDGLPWTDSQTAREPDSQRAREPDGIDGNDTMSTANAPENAPCHSAAVWPAVTEIAFLTAALRPGQGTRFPKSQHSFRNVPTLYLRVGSLRASHIFYLFSFRSAPPPPPLPLPSYSPAPVSLQAEVPQGQACTDDWNHCTRNVQVSPLLDKRPGRTLAQCLLRPLGEHLLVCPHDEQERVRDHEERRQPRRREPAPLKAARVAVVCNVPVVERIQQRDPGHDGLSAKKLEPPLANHLNPWNLQLVANDMLATHARGQTCSCMGLWSTKPPQLNHMERHTLPAPHPEASIERPAAKAYGVELGAIVLRRLRG
ncbi:hypothetical protein NPX13_g6226 [Xylaria arbuscula]|uniref:Uncharacterized protein n=1 Tax=Xylaria arbuscula TaxID=114810 RepID=A0A9W8TLY5_9PEZI|nr:hypothetical protein NPX13_g6226 [Xylaria arbuscula]